jgi:hypothetical protein
VRRGGDWEGEVGCGRTRHTSSGGGGDADSWRARGGGGGRVGLRQGAGRKGRGGEERQRRCGGRVGGRRRRRSGLRRAACVGRAGRGGGWMMGGVCARLGSSAAGGRVLVCLSVPGGGRAGLACWGRRRVGRGAVFCWSRRVRAVVLFPVPPGSHRLTVDFGLPRDLRECDLCGRRRQCFRWSLRLSQTHSCCGSASLCRECWVRLGIA